MAGSQHGAQAKRLAGRNRLDPLSAGTLQPRVLRGGVEVGNAALLASPGLLRVREVLSVVPPADLPRISDVEKLALVDQHAAVAESLDRGHVMGDQDDRPVRRAHLAEYGLALLLERGVPDR